MNFLAIDPGLRNCAAVLCEVSRDRETKEVSVKVIWSVVRDLRSKKTNPDYSKGAEFAEEVSVVLSSLEDVAGVLIEYQPPMNVKRNPALVRWNSSIEGFFFGYLIRNFPVKHVYSSVVKKFFRIASGGHGLNKSLAKEKAKEFIDKSETRKMTDHEADCILMCVFEFIKRNP